MKFEIIRFLENVLAIELAQLQLERRFKLEGQFLQPIKTELQYVVTIGGAVPTTN